MGPLTRDEITKIRVLIGRDPLPAVDGVADQAQHRQNNCTSTGQATVRHLCSRSTHRDSQPEDVWVPEPEVKGQAISSVENASKLPYEFGLPLSPVIESAESSASPSSPETVLDTRVNSEQHSPSTGPTDPGSDQGEDGEDECPGEHQTYEDAVEHIMPTPGNGKEIGDSPFRAHTMFEEESIKSKRVPLVTKTELQKKRGSDGTSSTPLSGSSDTQLDGEEHRMTQEASSARWGQVAVNF